MLWHALTWRLARDGVGGSNDRHKENSIPDVGQTMNDCEMKLERLYALPPRNVVLVAAVVAAVQSQPTEVGFAIAVVSHGSRRVYSSRTAA